MLVLRPFPSVAYKCSMLFRWQTYQHSSFPETSARMSWHSNSDLTRTSLCLLGVRCWEHPMIRSGSRAWHIASMMLHRAWVLIHARRGTPLLQGWL